MEKGFSRTEIILDPTANEEDKIGECEIRAKLLIAYMPSMNEVTQIHHIGEIEYSKMQEARVAQNNVDIIIIR